MFLEPFLPAPRVLVAGVGVTHVLSYQAARPIAEGKLQVVLQDFEPAPMTVSLVHAGQGLVPLKIRRFLEFAAPRLRRTLSEAGCADRPQSFAASVSTNWPYPAPWKGATNPPPTAPTEMPHDRCPQ